MKLARSGRWTPAAIAVVIVMLVVSFLWLYPVLWPVFSAFKTPQDLYSSGYHLWPKDWTLDNFARAWVNASFSRYLLNSILYSCLSTAISVIAAGLAGYALARYRFPGHKLITILVLAFLFLPTTTSILPIFDLMNSIGLLNTIWATVFALTGGTGFSVLLFRGYFAAMPQELFDAAAVDGAGFVRTFRLAFPLAKPIIATTVILGFTSSWQEYFIPLVFTLSTPNLRTVSVGLRAFTQQYSVDLPGFTAAVTISMVPLIVVFIFFQRYFVEGLAGAIKE